MDKYLVSVNDLPPNGKEFILEDQAIWREPMAEFKMDCKIDKPLRSKIFVMPSDGGCLVRGEIEGQVIVPCNRCTEDAKININSHFDEFEEIPDQPIKKSVPGESHIVFEKNFPLLNLAEVAWEQFMLALPPNPLCRDDCKGLCGKCGTNLNLGNCECSEREGDPRMAAFKNIKINK